VIAVARALLLVALCALAPVVLAPAASADVTVGVPVCNVKSHVCVCEWVHVEAPVDYDPETCHPF
jgi:hypothetical protein